MTADASSALLQVHQLGIRFPTPRGELVALDNVSLNLPKGRTLGIVGESGSGKSVLSRAIMRLLPGKAHWSESARIVFDGVDLLGLSKSRMRDIRGRRIAMVFQDPLTALNPVRTIGAQLIEGMQLHLNLSSRQAAERAGEILAQVGMTSPLQRLKQYPHELSGGMRQRVVIAMAISCEPELLIADEPTTALDVTVQADILDLLSRLQQERQMALMLITHDLGVAAGHCDEIAVMYGGQLMERTTAHELFHQPRMPYTTALLRSIPRLEDPPHSQLQTIPGRPPTLFGDSRGCRFAPRCSRARPRCQEETPELRGEGSSHCYRCLYPLEAS